MKSNKEPKMRKQLNPEKPLHAIRLKCLDCCGYSPELAKERGYVLTDEDYKEAEASRRACDIKSCPLYPFKDGKNPFHKVTEAQLKNGLEALKKYRQESLENGS